MVQLDNIAVSFGANLALDTGTRTLDNGTTVALMGPNGSGKTTLLRVIGGLQSPSRGHLRTQSTNDQPFTVAYVAQHQHQHQWMPLTVGEVLAMGRYRSRGLLGRMRSEDRAAIGDAADRLDVADMMKRSFGDLSGGQRQRVLVASALANQASCLLLDEPITGLDLPSQQIILDVIDAERDSGHLVVISTHHLDEANHCDRVLLLNTTVIADGPPVEVLNEANLAGTFGVRVLKVDLTGDSAKPVVLLDDHGHGH